LKKNNDSLIKYVIIGFIVLIFLGNLFSKDSSKNDNYQYSDDDEFVEYSDDTFSIISSQENQDLEDVIKKYCEDNDINVQIKYAGTLDIMEELNSGNKYDAVWASNSIWLYMLDSKVVKTSNSASTNINPVVFAIRESKAKELGFVGKELHTEDIVKAIESGNLKFSMSNPTRTNTGATAYLGLLSYLAGNPQVLKEADIENPEVKEKLVNLFSGMERSSGSEDFLEEMFLNSDYECVVTYESSIINMNLKLQAEGKETLYCLYPVDGVSISDSPFAYINNGNDTKKEQFEEIQNYILSNDGQKALAEHGRRTWFGGVNDNVDKKIFNPDWGIDTTTYIVPIKFPSTAIIQKSLAMYQSELRKPVHIVFGLDYSSSMRGSGYTQLKDAMNYILDSEQASKDLLQFTEKDKITIIPFSTYVMDTWSTDNGENTQDLINKVVTTSPYGSTNIYDTVIEGLNVLKNEDLEKYNVSIVLMTDGQSNMGSYYDFAKAYKEYGNNIPVYSIMFGSAYQSELDKIAEDTNGKVFDGRTSLVEAFKEVRGYN